MIETGHETLSQPQPVETQTNRKALTRKKSAKLMRSQFLEQSGQLEEAQALYREVARMEEEISDRLMDEGREDKATINLVSAASCWKAAGQYERALELLTKVLEQPNIPSSLKKEVLELKTEWQKGLSDSSPQADDIIRLLREWSAGNSEAVEKLVPLVYDELDRIAANYVSQMDPTLNSMDPTLNSGVLVNEVFLRLVDCRGVEWKNRTHFFATASKIMRRLIVDYAREHAALKRGGQSILTFLDETAVPVKLLDLNEALNQLEKIDPQLSQVVELHYFGGLTVKETAESLEVHVAIVERDLKAAKAFLSRAISSG